MYKQKGFAPILIVIIIAVLVGGYFIYQNKNKPTLQLQPQNSVNTPKTPQPTASPSATVVETNNNLYILQYIFKKGPKYNNDENHYDIIIKLPQGSATDNTNKTLILNGSKYKITGIDKTFGLCPMEDDGSGCTYNDDSSGIAKPLRIWKDNSGVFALNPQSIILDGYSINNFKIYKESPNKIFTQEEINLWKSLLETIEIVPSKLFTQN